MFGDCIMILEFLNHFGDTFDLNDDFPNGFNFDLLENALFSTSCDSALCNLLLFFLDTVFKCYDEETFDSDSDADSTHSSDSWTNDDDNQDPNDSDDHLLDSFYTQPHKTSNDRDTISQLADSYIHKIKSIQGRSLKSIGLDVYTISEMLRLYFMTSGAVHTSKVKYWYQQRGGYTHMDECGIDFVLNERRILDKLERMNVYELEPSEKLKILTCLCHQLVSHLRFRDLLDDNFQKLYTLKGQLRDLQTEENRRQREEVSERWRRKMLAKEKEKARALELIQSAQTQTQAAATPNGPGSKESSSLLNEMLAREEEKTKIAEEKARLAEEKFNNECLRKREEFVRRESKLVDEIYELQTVYSMCPIGKDRFFRRYWVFKSLPGVFVEDDDEDGGEFERMQNDGGVSVSLGEVKSEPDSMVAVSAATTSNGGDVKSDANDGKENKPNVDGLIGGEKRNGEVKDLKSTHFGKFFSLFWALLMVN